jgi:RimJ/RimL family protein N-acetyltransferase
VAVTLPENLRSIRVLESIGLAFERMFRLPGDQAELRLHAARRTAPAAPTRS